MKLAGKTALVTGGSRGIGAAVARALAAEGARVAIVYQSNEAAAQAVADQVTAASGEALCLQADVRDGARAEQVVETVVNSWGQLQILVNCAGVIRDGLFAVMSPEQWDTVVGTNLTGTYNYCRAAAQPMISRRQGVIINISSVAADFGTRGQANYAASKGGINALTRTLARELSARKIRVNAVSPGLIETDMSEAVRNLAGEHIRDLIPLKRVGKPEEVATVVSFLASDDAAYITGQIIRVDGGLSLGGY